MIPFRALFTILLAISSLWAQTIKYPKPRSENDTRYVYGFEMLKHALDATKDVDGDYTLQPTDKVLTHSRSNAWLKSGKIDLVYGPTSIQAEQELLPVRIPIEKGLLGYRVFLIDKNKQKIFSDIQTLEELKTKRAGLGAQWKDVEIFEKNGFKVVTGVEYESLFQMLLNDRFDFFSRGINEAPSEYESRKAQMPNLHIEESILLYYPFPRYFFFTKNDKGKALATRVARGLDIIRKNGLFEKTFKKYRGEMIQSANINQRKIFTIQNPLLPKETPLTDKSLWFDPTRF